MEFLVSALSMAGVIVLAIIRLLVVNAVQQRPGRPGSDFPQDDGLSVADVDHGRPDSPSGRSKPASRRRQG